MSSFVARTFQYDEYCEYSAIIPNIGPHKDRGCTRKSISRQKLKFNELRVKYQRGGGHRGGDQR